MIDLPAFDALALSLHHSPGVHAILVGSGLSRAAGIPTGWEITLNLIGRLAALAGVTESEDWVAWYRAKYSKEPSYSEILDTLASTQAERRAILESFIAAADDGEPRKPTKAHHAIAQLVASGAVRVVVTTNFDRLIEAALRDAGVEPTVIASDDAIAGATPLVHAKCTVIKVHGDYLDTRIKNTDAELADYSPAMNALLDQVFDNFGLLAVGWSGEWDAALRSAILRAPSRRYPFYWAARGTVGTSAQGLIDQRGGRSFPITDADSFFVKLGETLEALKQASRPHPQSVEMAIALARRYCRDDKFAMEWAEFLHDEVEKVRSFVAGPEYAAMQPNPDGLNKIVNALVSRSEVLRRSFVICGRWGTKTANRTAMKAINSLVLSPESKGGDTMLINLRDFVASLGFYWNVAGLIERDAWDEIYSLFNSEVDGRHDKETLIERLPLATYYQRSVDWRALSGLNRRHTPASDFLFDLFSSEAKDISIAGKRAEDLFDRVELLVAIGFAHQRLIRSQASDGHVWMPVGRFIWKSEGEPLTKELKRLSALPDADPFFKAGLLGGSRSSAEPTLVAIGKFHEMVASQFW